MHKGTELRQIVAIAPAVEAGAPASEAPAPALAEPQAVPASLDADIKALEHLRLSAAAMPAGEMRVQIHDALAVLERALHQSRRSHAPKAEVVQPAGGREAAAAAPVKAVEADDERGAKLFARAVGDVKPWSLDKSAFSAWWLEQLDAASWLKADEADVERCSKLLDQKRLIGEALEGCSGLDILRSCIQEYDKTPWFRLVRGSSGAPLKPRIKYGLIQHMSRLFDSYGLSVYALLWRVCRAERSPLMDYSWEASLGAGGYGQVHKMLHRHQNPPKPYAIKLVKCNEETLDSVTREMEHHSRAGSCSEYVVKLESWGTILDEYLFMVLEYCAGGDLAHKITKDVGIEDASFLWKIVEQTTEGLMHIHGADLIHLDIKVRKALLTANPRARALTRLFATQPLNLLITENGDIRIADLGLALFVENIEVTATQTHKGGTPGERAHFPATMRSSFSILNAPSSRRLPSA